MSRETTYIGSEGETLEEAEERYEKIRGEILHASPAFDTDATRPGDASATMFNLRVYWFDSEKGVGEENENLREMTLFNMLNGMGRKFYDSMSSRTGKSHEDWKGEKFMVYCTRGPDERRAAGVGI